MEARKDHSGRAAAERANSEMADGKAATGRSRHALMLVGVAVFFYAGCFAVVLLGPKLAGGMVDHGVLSAVMALVLFVILAGVLAVVFSAGRSDRRTRGQDGPSAEQGQ